MKLKKRDDNSLFLVKSGLKTKIVALLIMGGGPFACREWKSLSILTLLITILSFSTSIKGIFSLTIGFIVSLLFVFVGTSSFLSAHQTLQSIMIAFSAYGVGLYGILNIAPFITQDEILDASRKSNRKLRKQLVIITHVPAFFLGNHAKLFEKTIHNLRVSGVLINLYKPYTLITNLYHLFCCLWLFILVEAESYTIAIGGRLLPVLENFKSSGKNPHITSYMVILITALACYIIFMDFIASLFEKII